MRNRSLFHIAVLLLVLLASTGCRHKGEMLVQFEQAAPEHTELKTRLEQSDIVPLVLGLTNSVRLKELTYVSFREDDLGPRYEEFQIVIPYGFLAETRQELEKDGEWTPEQLDELVLAQAKFVLFHEIGHALIQQLDIPVVGREEDAVDGLATLLAVGVLKSPDIALGAALALDASEDPDGDYLQQDFWDEHSLTPQRYYSILCWVKGGAPDWNSEVEQLVPEEWLEAKGEDCPDEYEKLARNWTKLLKPHLKPGVIIRQRRKNREN